MILYRLCVGFLVHLASVYILVYLHVEVCTRTLGRKNNFSLSASLLKLALFFFSVVLSEQEFFFGIPLFSVHEMYLL